MKYFFITLLVIPFLYLNFKIIFSDFKFKKIPNKYLLLLLALLIIFYIYLFIFYKLNLITTIIYFLLATFISFILYYFGIWSAGDAKYLLVLSLYLPHLGIIPIICNIAIITISYLLIYFIWFYFGKCLIDINYGKSIFKSVYSDLNGKWISYKNGKKGNTLFILFKWILIFLLIFVSIRLSRIYLINYFFNDIGDSSIIFYLLSNYSIYLIFGTIAIIIIVIFFIKKIYNILIGIISYKLKINIKKINFFLLLIITIVLIGFITYEYIIDKNSLLNNLYNIFTIYIIIYLIIKILIYSYKITFQLGEQDYIDINDLKEGDIVDKSFLENLFGNQDFLFEEGDYKILDTNVKEYIRGFTNPIDKETKQKIVDIYNMTNIFLIKNNTGFETSKKVKILNTFAFGIYIFCGFLLTVLLYYINLNPNLIIYIIQKIIN